MKNRRIHFDDYFFWTIFSIVFSVISLIIFVLSIEKLPPWAFVILAITFSIFLAGARVFPRLGIHFNYKTGLIKYFGHTKIIRSKILMKDVLSIDFRELPATKQKGMTPQTYIIYGKYALDEVYRNGKIFMFYVHLVSGEVINIPYFYLFKSCSKRRVQRQEKIINRIIAEFNQYIAEQRANKPAE